MKYVVVLCDGMADYPVPALGGKTPMMTAHKPHMDELGAKGEVGLVQTVAEGLKPGSDVANLSVMGYDPKLYYTGRSPLEAVSMGIDLQPEDIALRCNLVTLTPEEHYGDRSMEDYCAGDISTREGAELIQALQQQLGSETFTFYPGVSYRHCLVWKGGSLELGHMTPPHDISSQVIAPHLSSHPNAKPLIDLMKKSVEILAEHPVNRKRVEEGKRPATSVWLWGEGKKPALPAFQQEFGKKGMVISAVDLLKGIGLCAGMEVPEVEGATGYLDTNFEGKVQAALQGLEQGCDFVYLHIEAPDECGHRNEPENKVKAIELIDKKVLSVLRSELPRLGAYRIMILPDHATPIVTRTHASDPVPYLIYRSDAEEDSGVSSLNEESAKTTGVFVEHGPDLMKRFLQ